MLLESEMYNCCTVCVALCMCCKVACFKLYCLYQHCLLIGEINSYMYNKCCSSSKLWSHSTLCLKKSFHLGTLRGGYCRMGFVANFTCFPVVKNVENPLRFDKVTESLKVGTFSETQCTCHSLLGHFEQICIRWNPPAQSTTLPSQVPSTIFTEHSILNSTQLNSTSLNGRRCEHLNVRI